jgi:hypothetical protein
LRTQICINARRAVGKVHDILIPHLPARTGVVLALGAALPVRKYVAFLQHVSAAEVVQAAIVGAIESVVTIFQFVYASSIGVADVKGAFVAVVANEYSSR